jgi:hypothetical protein
MTEEASTSTKPFWQEHLGILVSAALSIFVIFKVSAVAGWNPTTARGIVTENGTTNVLIGSTLASLPTLYVFFFLAVLPRIEARLELRKRSPVERSAAGMLQTWPVTLLLFIVPIYLVIAMFGFLLLSFVARIIVRKRKVEAKPENRVSRFEANAVLLSALVWSVFFSLSSPWLATETITVAGRGEATGYVLGSDDRGVVVLLDRPRRLERFDVSTIETAFCERHTSWINKTVLQFSSQPGYPKCPASELEE